MGAVTGIVLAGGQGSRMGGVDKGLQVFRGKPMVAHVIERLAPQVDEVIINANRNVEAYGGFGHREYLLYPLLLVAFMSASRMAFRSFKEWSLYGRGGEQGDGKEPGAPPLHTRSSQTTVWVIRGFR